MFQMKFKKELYSKIALIKAAYNFTDKAYVHLDADEIYYYVSVERKMQESEIDEKSFINEMLAQSVRHEVYKETKNIRELLMARAMATSLVADENMIEENEVSDEFSETEILKDWFEENEEIKY